MRASFFRAMHGICLQLVCRAQGGAVSPCPCPPHPQGAAACTGRVLWGPGVAHLSALGAARHVAAGVVQRRAALPDPAGASVRLLDPHVCGGHLDAALRAQEDVLLDRLDVLVARDRRHELVTVLRRRRRDGRHRSGRGLERRPGRAGWRGLGWRLCTRCRGRGRGQGRGRWRGRRRRPHLALALVRLAPAPLHAGAHVARLGDQVRPQAQVGAAVLRRRVVSALSSRPLPSPLPPVPHCAWGAAHPADIRAEYPVVAALQRDVDGDAHARRDLALVL